jgi:hypothetical protein
MKIFTALLLIFLLFSSGAKADINDNGGYAGAFLRMGLGARSIALGNCGAADAASGFSHYYNPAILPMLSGKSVALSYSFMPLDRHTQYIGYSMQVKPSAGLSIGWIESGVNDLQGTNSIGQFTGEIDHSLHGIYFSFGRYFGKRFSLGVTVKLVMEYLSDSNFKYSSMGVGFNFGAYYKISENISAAAVIYDINTKLEANTQDIFTYGGKTVDQFPVLYRFGIRYITPVKWLRAMYDFESSSKGGYANHIGLEALHGDNLALRIGYSGDKFQQTGDFISALSFGAGMDFKLYKFNSFVDYAFTPGLTGEGATHIFSWQIFF